MEHLNFTSRNCYHPYRQHGSFQRFRKKRSDFNIMAVQAAVMSDGYSEGRSGGGDYKGSKFNCKLASLPQSQSFTLY